MAIKDSKRPWWMDEPISPHNYRQYNGKISKSDKILSAMAEIVKINASIRPLKKLDRNIVVLKGLQV
jgi:hypothetical protein